MKGFENDRNWIIEKKNDVAIRAMDNKEKTDQFIKKRDVVEEGIARIFILVEVAKNMYLIKRWSKYLGDVIA